MRSPCSSALSSWIQRPFRPPFRLWSCVMPVRFTTSLMMSSLIKNSLRSRSRNAILVPHQSTSMIGLNLFPLSSEASGQARPSRGEEFRRGLRRFANGVTIASVVDAKGTPHGLTVSSFTSVSLDPPLILICLGHAVAAIECISCGNPFRNQYVWRSDQRPCRSRLRAQGPRPFRRCMAWTGGRPRAADTGRAGRNRMRACTAYVPHGGITIFWWAKWCMHEVADGKPLLHFCERLPEAGSTGVRRLGDPNAESRSLIFTISWNSGVPEGTCAAAAYPGIDEARRKCARSDGKQVINLASTITWG